MTTTTIGQPPDFFMPHHHHTTYSGQELVFTLCLHTAILCKSELELRAQYVKSLFPNEGINTACFNCFSPNFALFLAMYQLNDGRMGLP